MYARLSEKQKTILDKTGKFVVRACPGSGKTYCVSAKLSKLISEWKLLHQGIATISFTNTAWQEIEKKCHEDFNTAVSYPHFLGTIDSFINQYIFLPFGHLVLECDKRPVMVGEPYGIWGGGTNDQDPTYYFDKVSYDIDGDLYGKEKKYFMGAFPPQKNKDGTVNKVYFKLATMKESLLKKGFATQSDANFFAMVLLEKYPIIRKTLAARFPWLIVDEAQDTTKIQMRILDLLISENKEQNVMMVGDPDQAIFEWNDASPEFLIEKQKLWEANSVIFDESWRSSQKICDAIYRLSSLGDNKITAVKKEVKDFDCDPEICLWQDGKKSEVVKKFLAKCKENGIDVTPKTTVILARAKGFFSGVQPNMPNPWLNTCPYARDFAIGKFLIDNKDFVRGVKYIEKGYIKHEKKLHFCSEKELQEFIEGMGFVEFKKEIKKILAQLPTTADTKLGAWFDSMAANFKQSGIGISFLYNAAAKDLIFSHAFPHEYNDNIQRPYRLSTIHKVKGETFEAVLLFLRKKVSKNYKTLIEKSSVTEDEELRNVYVAISRPSKLLMIAVTDEEDKKCWTDKLLTAK